MKRNTLLFALVLCFFGLATGFAADPSIGTWKLNEAKSKVPAGSMKNSTAVYVEQGDKIKCTTDGIVGTNTPLHIEWIGEIRRERLSAYRRFRVGYPLIPKN